MVASFLQLSNTKFELRPLKLQSQTLITKLISFIAFINLRSML